MNADAEDVNCVQRAVQWAKDRIESGEEGSASGQTGISTLSEAFIIRILLLGKDGKGIQGLVNRTTEHVLHAQQPDGSWPSSARLRIPPPGVLDPEGYQNWMVNGKGGGSIISDQHRIFTTATIVTSLQKALR